MSRGWNDVNSTRGLWVPCNATPRRAAALPLACPANALTKLTPTSASTAHTVKDQMATAPVRPRAYATWLTEVTAITPALPDAGRHALCLFGPAKMLFTRWSPAVLCPEFCRRQTFDAYDPDVWQRVGDSTQLIVFRNCTVADVWRDRKVIESALQDVHIVFLFENEVKGSQSPQPFLATSVGMRSDNSIFLCVTPQDLKAARDEGAGSDAAPADQPQMVEVLASKKRCFDQTRALTALGIGAETARKLVDACDKLAK